MHYYQKNIGDYYKKAGRLSMLQHGAYTLLIDACYDRERFPTLEEAIEWSWASTSEEIEAVKFVLAKFFHLSVDNYVQSRVETELEKYKITGLINQLIAFSREARKKKRDSFAVACDELRDKIKNDPLSKTHAAWSSVIEALVKQHETAPNQEPITNNHKPITNLKDTSQAPKFDSTAAFDKFWLAYPSRTGSKGSKKKSLAKFKSSCKTGEDFDLIMKGLNNHISAWSDPNYIPMVTTWLNGDCWNDDVYSPEQKTDLNDLVNDELFKMAEGMGIHTQGLYRKDLINAIQAKTQ